MQFSLPEAICLTIFTHFFTTQICSAFVCYFLFRIFDFIFVTQNQSKLLGKSAVIFRSSLLESEHLCITNHFSRFFICFVKNFRSHWLIWSLSCSPFSFITLRTIVITSFSSSFHDFSSPNFISLSTFSKFLQTFYAGYPLTFSYSL